MHTLEGVFDAGKVAESISPVKELKVASDKELKLREVVGDGLEHDHIPSFAALLAAKEMELGRPLTKAEEKTLYKNATAIEVPKGIHIESPIYGGKNNISQARMDAFDLCGAVCRDTTALRIDLLNRGYDEKIVNQAIKEVIDRNKLIGVIK
ncbi:hypothetical protein [Oryzomicrobium sp.]|uniref:hypothetical protein n=1 Tax=Oryzomicrobium sp. TaxID=1911578 RepID=UPI0025D77FD9|nr:hypothetical protein [Oryzomicrobium sp.]